MKMTTSVVAGLVAIGLFTIGMESALAQGSVGGNFAKGNPRGRPSSSAPQQLTPTPANQA
jgi:hypothetical protein